MAREGAPHNLAPGFSPGFAHRNDQRRAAESERPIPGLKPGAMFFRAPSRAESSSRPSTLLSYYLINFFTASEPAETAERS